MKTIANRAAIIVRPKTPFVEWVQSAAEESRDITAEEIQEEPNVYLVQDYELNGEADQLLAENFAAIFEEELRGWIADESLWPQKRDLKVFLRWFQADFQGTVLDLSDEDYLVEEE